MDCDRICEKLKIPCKKTECDNYIEYESDMNCVLVCARQNGPMTLDEVSKRLGVSYVRIKQIEDKAIEKMKAFMKQEEMAF